ncbi:MAG: alpha-glucan family phosphorylase [Porphyromonas sp.]|nr:alpha-glucan family phosphorylase [Porphyromonas sp.]
MIQSKSPSQPTWRDIYTYSKLPSSLANLDELAHNLWWVWNLDAQQLFEELNPEVWHTSNGNPVKVLASLTQTRLKEISVDESYLARLRDVYARFQAYMKEPMRTDAPSVAYFSMEYGLTNVLKIYSGGLGVLAGDYMKEASDSLVDMVGVGFLYRQGYFDQVITKDGQQLAEYTPANFKEIPVTQETNEDGTPLVLTVPFRSHVVYCHIWRVDVGRVRLYLLDSDLPQNSEWDRYITYQLYGGDWENRMKQEYLLGIGGMLALKKLGIKQEIYHLNEGHASFINVQRLAQYVEEEGMSFDEALEVVRASSLYTVHTPVPAGHDYFDEQLFTKYLGHFPDRLGITPQEFIDMGRENPGSHEKFSMSVFALNTCQEANGVSELHGKVSQNMFAPVWKGFLPEELHVGFVTNGVHLPTWAADSWKTFYTTYIASDILHHQADGEMWKKAHDLPDEEVWNMRMAVKKRLLHFLEDSVHHNIRKEDVDPSTLMSIADDLNPDALLVGFGRRFATYKRAHLLFTDLNRLSQIVNNPDRPVQFIFTGKAHPADGGGQGLIKHIIEISKCPEFKGKILFLQNYDIRVAQNLIAGVDVWLNTPTRPLEASGTSGMKAVMNGALNFSVLDGWWYEGYVPGGGWALTDKRTYQDQSLQDQLDAATIYKIFEEEIIPLYFDRTENPNYSVGWVRDIKTSIAEILPRFTMKRMIEDYIRKFYVPLAERHRHITRDNYADVHEIIAWKKHVTEKWGSLEVIDVNLETENHNPVNFRVGEQIKVTLQADLHELESDLCVELMVASTNTDGSDRLDAKYQLQLVAQEGSRRTYQLVHDIDKPGSQKVALRIVPTHPLLPHAMDFAHNKWVPLY